MTSTIPQLRVLFMGTPDFAVASLQQIHESSIHKIIGVVTAVDKPAGRGRKLKSSSVKNYAVKQELPLLQPENLKDPNFVNSLTELKPDIIVVVAFRMLPKVVWDLPKYGTFNLHASLLPQYRGAAPINWAIINGEIQSGVTTFFIDEKIDTGSILLQKQTAIKGTDTVKELHDTLMEIGSELVIETLNRIALEDIKPSPQKETSGLKTAYKLNRENMKIDWSKDSNSIYNLIRGLSPYPSSWCFLEEENKKQQQIKITKASIIKPEDEILPKLSQTKENGKLQVIDKRIIIHTQDGFIELETLQLPNKKSMNAKELLNGHSFSDDSKLC